MIPERISSRGSYSDFEQSEKISERSSIKSSNRKISKNASQGRISHNEKLLKKPLNKSSKYYESIGNSNGKSFHSQMLNKGNFTTSSSTKKLSPGRGVKIMKRSSLSNLHTHKSHRNLSQNDDEHKAKLKQMQSKILRLQRKISEIKNSLRISYEIDKIISLENDLSNILVYV